MTLTKLTIHQIEFNLRAETRLHLGVQAGAQFRGALWSHLKRLACNDPNQKSAPEHSHYCPACFLLELEAPSARGINPPRPFVLRPPLAVRAEDDRYYLSGEPLTIGIGLIGYAVSLFPYLAQAIMQIGRDGVGYQRGRYSIDKIESVHPLSQKRQNLLSGGVAQLPVDPLTEDEVTRYSAQLPADAIRLRFLTPTQITQQAKIIERPLFAPIIARLLERIEAVIYHYTQTLEPDDWAETYQQRVASAEAVQVIQDNTRWIHAKSGSRRANRLQDVSGFVGEVKFAGDLIPFLPYLVWGQSLHVGKNTPKGNGWYEIAP